MNVRKALYIPTYIMYYVYYIYQNILYINVLYIYYICIYIYIYIYIYIFPYIQEEVFKMIINLQYVERTSEKIRCIPDLTK